MSLLRIITTALVLLAAGCQTSRDAELLCVESLAPDRLEPGTRVSLVGEGFPTGRPAVVTFEGVVHRPGLPSRPVNVRADGRAVSSEEVRFEASSSTISSLGERGTFDGRVRVVFEAAEAMGSVSGTLEARVDVAPTASRRLASRMELERHARRWLDEAGFTIEEEGTEAGVAVATVEGSAARRAGLRPGDRIVEAGGVRPASLADLAPPPSAQRVTVRVRQGHGGSEPAELHLPGPSSATDVPAGLPWGAALLVVLLCFAGTGARPMARLLCAVEDGCARATFRGAGSREALRALLIALLASGVVMVPGLLAWLTPVYIACVIAALLLRGRRGSFAASAGALLGPLAVITSLTATTLLESEPAGGWPLAFAHPVGFAAFACAVRGAFGPVQPSRRMDVLAADEAARAVAAVVLVAHFVRPAFMEGPWVALAIWAAAVLLAGAGSAALRHARRVPHPGHVVVAVLVVPATALAWSWAEVPGWIASTVAPAVAMACGVVTLAAAGRGLWVRFRGRAAPELRLHPFL
ncbi:MAG: PDZ domain-containing protein [Myxococcota bacterium]